MSPLPKKYHLLVWISLALVTGFLTTRIAGYLAPRGLIAAGGVAKLSAREASQNTLNTG